MEPVGFNFLRYVIQGMNVVTCCLAAMKNITGRVWSR